MDLNLDKQATKAKYTTTCLCFAYTRHHPFCALSWQCTNNICNKLEKLIKRISYAFIIQSMHIPSKVHLQLMGFELLSCSHAIVNAAFRPSVELIKQVLFHIMTFSIKLTTRKLYEPACCIYLLKSLQCDACIIWYIYVHKLACQRGFMEIIIQHFCPSTACYVRTRDETSKKRQELFESWFTLQC